MSAREDKKLLARTLVHSIQHVEGRFEHGTTNSTIAADFAREVKGVLQHLDISLDEALDLLRDWGKHERTIHPIGFDMAWKLEETNMATGCSQ